MAEHIITEYEGEVRNPDRLSESPAELERCLSEIKGIGPVRARIFLRELRGNSEHADSVLTEMEIETARDLRLIDEEGTAIEQIKA
ncbi:hypothetical protein EU538_12340 [Candidatus Thorarchaeota archaeon]|nr:MAG: hypothetical protein EU538_12340 [Candidatus Thorarchaeota archaeon]